MLVEFRFRNHKSFKDEQVLSMVASKSSELPEHLIPADNLGKGKSLLDSAIIYGANASGKSNIIDALQFAKRIVTVSAKREPGNPIPVQPFLLDAQSVISPSEYEFMFIHNDVPYQYGFVLDKELIREEWLISYPRKLPQIWFERKSHPEPGEKDWYWGPSLKGEKSTIKELTRPDMLFLSVAAQFNHKQLTEVYQWFRRGMLIVPASAEWTAVERISVNKIHESSELKEQVVSLLKMADFGVDGIETEKETLSEEDDIDPDAPEELQDIVRKIGRLMREIGDGPVTRMRMQMLHSADVGNGRSVPFNIDDESLGTRRMLAVAVPLLDTLEQGKALIVDEIDSSLHPILVRQLIKMFSDPRLNKNGAQLIFNTHDVTLLDNSLFRRDQVWFTEKDSSGASHLYSLQDFKPRKTEALGKNYLQGRYGAVPVIDSSTLGI